MYLAMEIDESRGAVANKSCSLRRLAFGNS
jgi:hypothetical protein